MTFSITATIRAFVAPDHVLSCSARRWRKIVRELDLRGRRRHEAGAFLLGVEQHGRKRVLDAVYYDELDPRAYATGVCILHGDAFAKLWALCRKKKLTVVADVHTHGGAPYQSGSDRAHPMVARAGHIAVIVPDFARWPIPASRLGIYEYVGAHEWIDRTAVQTPGYFYTGLWGEHERYRRIQAASRREVFHG
jgi:Prokaryotic homologs of the JAB domain